MYLLEAPPKKYQEFPGSYADLLVIFLQNFGASSWPWHEFDISRMSTAKSTGWYLDAVGFGQFAPICFHASVSYIDISSSSKGVQE